jgi:Uma2 family endonuclease
VPLRYNLGMSAARKHATEADLLNLPPDVKAHLVYGMLHVHSRPAPRHANTSSSLGELLKPPFRRGRGGPGGWIILDEPELRIAGHVMSPDLSGWRREHVPDMPTKAYFDVRPDWVCEVLSPGTAGFDRGDKMLAYAELGVPYVWLVDPEARTLEVLELEVAKGKYGYPAVFQESAKVHAKPFEVFELDLSVLWVW